jgi:hypothetical protein
MNNGTVIKAQFPSTVYEAEKTRLYDLLRSVEPQQTVTYEQMTSVCGQDVRGKYRGILYAVLKRLEHEQASSFEVVRGVGYVCLTNDGIVGSSTSKVYRLRRAGRRIKKQLAVAEYTKLSSLSQIAYSVNMAIAHVVSEGTKAKTRKALEAASAKTIGPVLPLTDTLALLASKS